MTQPIVAVKTLNHYYGEGDLRRQVLFDIELEIHPGEFVIMTGPSGSGKSTLLSLIGCLRSVQMGSLQVLGQELKGASTTVRTRVRQNFGYIFQASNLLTFLTVEQNIATSLTLQGIRDRQAIRQKTTEILDSVGLLPQLKYYPRQLSGGQKQRAAIAGALVTRPKLVLADEPTAALDSHTGRQTIELMHRLSKEQGSAVLLVTHDPRILDVANRIIQVEDGKLGLAYSQEISLALPGLKEDTINAMGIQPDVLSYEPGAIVFREGDRADRFYMILQGAVDVFRERPEHPLKILSTLGRGKYFGEIGLLNRQSVRTASIRVTSDGPAKLMTIKAADFRRLMRGSTVTEMAIAQTLQNRITATQLATALPTLDTAAIMRILPKVERFTYGAGSYIVKEGDPADYFYVIIAGIVETVMQDRQGQPLVIATLSIGDYFGEIGLMEQRARTATVRAHPTTQVEVLALPHSVFKEEIEACQVTQTEIARVVYERLKKTGSSVIGGGNR